ncbi:MAG: carbohydrate ABC transporter substrate-binding protein [Anaerolineae bacterium]|nr:carbohydrate ABC transporter substrate-binding protein [Anaerolineae bacterium]
MKKVLGVALVLTLILALAPASTEAQEKVTLTIESWRNDDLTIWQDILIPAFNAAHPDIEVVFQPTAPTEYNGALRAKLEGGTAGDLITCRPFDESLNLFQSGHLVSLNELAGMENFSDVAKSAWITDDGSDVFCVPMASVIHGFLYNKTIFDELGLTEPTTETEFLALLEAVKADGLYAPLVMGTVDQWEAATMGYQNIGPNYWLGEEGRLGLIAGTHKYNEGGFLGAFEALARWQPYLPDGYQAISYPDAQNLFALGMGAVYPAGSWDISTFNPQIDFEMGAFKPPLPEGSENCYISDHVDIAMGVNANTPHMDEALIFMEWLTTAEFAGLYSNQLPGFFSLANHSIMLEDPVAQQFLDWRNECESTIRSAYQILSRGEPNNEQDLWLYSAEVLNGNLTPQEAADKVQEGLEAWYEPQQ